MISRRFRAMADHTPQKTSQKTRQNTSRKTPGKTKDWLAAAGTAAGFDICAVTTADLPSSVAAGLDDYIGAGHHGDMGWLADTRDRRITPSAMWSDARSAVVFGCNYGPDHDPMENLDAASSANISVYARGRDYHDVLKGRLKQLAGQLAARTGWQVKVFVDTAPLMEKPLAARAGLGWQGKHTNLVSRDYGSWLFLGTILTDGLLPPDAPASDACGSCTSCLDICPTDAFPAPYQLDARRCISYLTIEFDGHIPHEFRTPMGNRVFGCDDCLSVCPWNKFASASADMKLAAQDGRSLPSLLDMLSLDEPAFRQYFSASPVKRTGYIRFLRNCLIAAGNAGDTDLVPVITSYLGHEDARLRAMAVWALSHYMTPDELASLRPADEMSRDVQAEWKTALSQAD